MGIMASDIIFANDESKESLEKVMKGKLLFGLFESNAAGELTLLADSSKFPLTEKATSRPAFRDFETIEKSGEVWGLIQDKIFEADNLKPVTILAFLTLDDNDLKKKSVMCHVGFCDQSCSVDMKVPFSGVDQKIKDRANAMVSIKLFKPEELEWETISKKFLA